MNTNFSCLHKKQVQVFLLERMLRRFDQQVRIWSIATAL